MPVFYWNCPFCGKELKTEAFVPSEVEKVKEEFKERIRKHMETHTVNDKEELNLFLGVD